MLERIKMSWKTGETLTGTVLKDDKSIRQASISMPETGTAPVIAYISEPVEIQNDDFVIVDDGTVTIGYRNVKNSRKKIR